MSEHPDPYALKRPHARIDWTATGPVALDAGDVYFSAEDGLAETRSVFLKAANFPERFARGRPTVVAELGFGTGLNALALWQLCHGRAHPFGGLLRLQLACRSGRVIHHVRHFRNAGFAFLSQAVIALIDRHAVYPG